MQDEFVRRVRTNRAMNSVNDNAAALQVEWDNVPAPYIQCTPLCQQLYRRIMT